jgi:hypothetical protein
MVWCRGYVCAGVVVGVALWRCVQWFGGVCVARSGCTLLDQFRGLSARLDATSMTTLESKNDCEVFLPSARSSLALFCLAWREF